MTGTALTSAEEFDKVYGLDAIPIPTHEPMVRVDSPDKVYKTEKGKFTAIVREVKEKHQKGQPVLIGTRSVERNEYLGNLLEKVANFGQMQLRQRAFSHANQDAEARFNG